MPYARGRCHKCANFFSLGLAEMRMRTGKDPHRCNYRDPRTYADWEAHIIMTCPECRLKGMPDSCLDDLDRLIALEAQHPEIESDPYAHYDSFPEDY